jgi:hypothetical protein
MVIYKIKQKHKTPTKIYTVIQNRTKHIQECDKGKSHISSEHHIIYIRSASRK